VCVTFSSRSACTFNTLLIQPDHPALHLPHLLRILGPSSLTLYKHVLARRRVLIYTNPCVEPACILARIASDICGEDDRPNVLGIVGINDYDKLNTESWRGNGWIACASSLLSVYISLLDTP
jgi:DENN domain-containing protein 11